MTATCKCGTCGLSWFRCTCPEWPDEQMEPERTWAFWRNMSKQDVEAYITRHAKILMLQQQMDRAKRDLLLQQLRDL